MRSVALMMGVGVAVGVCAAGALGQGVGASAGGDGIDWVTVGALGNAAYPGDKLGQLAGRGSVGYEYRIGRFEVTTAQWLEFVNTFVNRTTIADFHGLQGFWGAGIDFRTGRWQLFNEQDFPNPSMIPVYGMSWRSAAMYVNWLHNGKSSDVSALMSGAYDISTFTTNADGSYNDQVTHSPGARYWIPTLDEWIKAVHYDPDRFGPGQPGWWEYANSSDEPPIIGLPGVGETAAGFDLLKFFALSLPLGSYPNQLSPWGLLDTSGGTAEWNEEVFFPGRLTNRGFAGSAVGLGPESIILDRLGQISGLPPDCTCFVTGLRIASSVPGPTTVSTVLAAVIFSFRRRRTCLGS